MTIEPFKGITVKQLLFLMRLLKLEHLEINFTMIPEIVEFEANLRKITTTFHLPIYSRNKFDLSSINPEFQNRIERIISFINLHWKKINLKYTLSHPIEDPRGDFNEYIKRLDQIETPIVLENIMGVSDKDFLNFYKKVKKSIGEKMVGITLDGPHKFVECKGNWLDFPEEFVKEIVYIHVSDCTKTTDLHLPLGFGEFPYKEFFSFLRKQNYNGIILHEILPSEGKVSEVIDSFLLCAKEFSKNKYRKLKIRYSFIEPLLQNKINLAFKEFNKSGKKLLIKDLNYDFIKT
ncbi:MAG: sugar phosphate isomerase/epimerase [Candidatus Heimdallarchaeota archaeon]|nr:sugar phosphate isomerase/epimerase [Candidatus Heimdallarchaeota archaeon]